MAKMRKSSLAASACKNEYRYQLSGTQKSLEVKEHISCGTVNTWHVRLVEVTQII